LKVVRFLKKVEFSLFFEGIYVFPLKYSDVDYNTLLVFILLIINPSLWVLEFPYWLSFIYSNGASKTSLFGCSPFLSGILWHLPNRLSLFLGNIKYCLFEHFPPNIPGQISLTRSDRQNNAVLNVKLSWSFSWV